MDGVRKYILENWPASIDGKITFCGVIDKYDSIISRRWSCPDTLKIYGRDYDRYILPELSDKPIADLTREDYDTMVEHLPLRKKEEGRVCNKIVERHIRYITKKVLEAASEAGICQDVLWGSEYSLPENLFDEKSDEKELVRTRKSLSISEELAIAQLVLADPTQDGEKMGLALMFCLGLRNNEACGANYFDVCSMELHPEYTCLRIYKSTVRGGSDLQSGGKTRNANRVIPIPDSLVQLLQQRQTFLTQQPQIQNGARETGLSVEKYIEGLPIVCQGNQYSVRCSAARLTAAGTTMLQSIAHEKSTADRRKFEEEIALIDADIRRPGRVEEGIREKDPTVYLFRRNLGTHLYLLGLSPEEIQYIIGHDIENDDDKRNYFRNVEKLYPIARKMSQRPIVNMVDSVNAVDFSGTTLQIPNSSLALMHIPLTEKSKYKLLIKQREPDDNISVVFSCDKASVEGTCSSLPLSESYHPSLNFIKLYHKEYALEAGKSTCSDETANNGDGSF